MVQNLSVPLPCWLVVIALPTSLPLSPTPPHAAELVITRFTCCRRQAAFVSGSRASRNKIDSPDSTIQGARFQYSHNQALQRPLTARPRKCHWHVASPAFRLTHLRDVECLGAQPQTTRQRPADTTSH
ncbi:hypothetical protein LY76DRAFT_586195 [Colletotrichum caudatum]|nr:hypothetical protein LY76DRAFT_586195 [Colletotrichum caudatum]